MVRPCILILLFVASVLVAPLARTAVAAHISAISGCFEPFTLQAVPGPVPSVMYGRGSPARDIPPGPVSVHLPLYPGSIPLAISLPYLSGPVMPSSYRKVTAATVGARAPLGKVMSWYRAALVACSLPITSSSTLQHGNAGLFSMAPDGLQWVSLTLHLVSNHATEVQYIVQVLSLPPRPASSYLHGPFVRATVAYNLHSIIKNSDRHYRFTINWPATLSGLVATVNGPTRIYVSDLQLLGGLVLYTERAVISFIRPDGGRRVVRVGGNEFTLTVGRSRPLIDTNERVMRLVDRIVQRRCGEHPDCR